MKILYSKLFLAKSISSQKENMIIVIALFGNVTICSLWNMRPGLLIQYALSHKQKLPRFFNNTICVINFSLPLYYNYQYKIQMILNNIK